MRFSPRQRRLRADLADTKEQLVRSIVLEPEDYDGRVELWKRHFDLLEKLS